jgi:galactokinase
VNLIGEHIDYNGGFVLPTPLPRWTDVTLKGRPDDRVRAASGRFERDGIQEFRLGEERAGRGWLDYVQALTRTLREDGARFTGFDARVDSDVPVGSGVSSSAALLVALARALEARFGLDLGGERIALLSWRAESEFVGAKVGIMDPMVSSLGRLGEALLLDTQRLTRRPVPLPPAIELFVVDSGIPHAHADGAYNTRREECERARELLGVGHLCDLGRSDLGRVARLPEPLGRRARHAVTENLRVQDAVLALEARDYARLGALLDESHRSLRDDFEVSTPEVDLLVSLLRSRPGVYGSRITGGGFGGSVLALADAGAGEPAVQAAVAAYERETSRRALVVEG